MAKKMVQPKTFEEASQRLETLVRKMEEGQMPLDDMIDAFEEGRVLVAYCNAKLTEVQHRVELIKAEEADGTLLREHFPEPPQS